MLKERRELIEAATPIEERHGVNVWQMSLRDAWTRLWTLPTSVGGSEGGSEGGREGGAQKAPGQLLVLCLSFLPFISYVGRGGECIQRAKDIQSFRSGWVLTC